MATVRVAGKVDGIPVGTNPVVVVELLVPTIGGHRTVQATTTDAQGRFCFEDLDMIEATFNQASEDLHVRVTAATRDGLRVHGVVCIPTSDQDLLSMVEPDLIVRLENTIELAPCPKSRTLLNPDPWPGTDKLFSIDKILARIGFPNPFTPNSWFAPDGYLSGTHQIKAQGHGADEELDDVDGIDS